MAIVAEYTLAQWQRQGGWRGVEAYVDGVVHRFDLGAPDPEAPGVLGRYFVRDDDRRHVWFEQAERIPLEVPDGSGS